MPLTTASSHVSSPPPSSNVDAIRRTSSSLCRCWRRRSLPLKTVRHVSLMVVLGASAVLAVVFLVVLARSAGQCGWDSGEESGGLWARHLLRSGKIVDNRDGLSQPNYNLTKPETDDYSEHGQSTALVKIFKHKRKGTYFEVGAFDGEFFSNSLKLEKELGWTGILVEPVPEFFKQMLKKGRRAAMLNACVSSKPWFDVIRINAPKKGTMHQKSTSAGEGTLRVGGKNLQSIPVECYPLIDILLACNSTSLDALFVDVQGPEYDILSNVPWERVDIKLIMAEISAMNKDRRRIERKMLDLLQPKGYKLIKKIGRDFIYMK